MKKFSMLYIVVFLTLNTTVYSQIKAQSFVDKKKVYLGDMVSLYIKISCSKEFMVEPFEIYEVLRDTSGVENFIVYDKKYKKTKSLFKKQIQHEFVFKLIPVKLGEVVINNLTVQVKNLQLQQVTPVELQQIKIEVLPYPKPKKKNFDGEIIDIKPQVWIKNYLWLAIVLLIVLSIIGTVLYQYNKKYSPQIEQQNLTVDIKTLAMEKLDKLWQKNYISLGLIKEFYLELTEIIRWYIGEKYNVNALELTTEELFVALKKVVDKKYNIELKSFLDNADLVKFAKYIPEEKQIVNDFNTAKKFIV